MSLPTDLLLGPGLPTDQASFFHSMPTLNILNGFLFLRFLNLSLEQAHVAYPLNITFFFSPHGDRSPLRMNDTTVISS